MKSGLLILWQLTRECILDWKIEHPETPRVMKINLSFFCFSLGDTDAITKNFLGKSEGVQIQPSGHVSYWLPVHLMTFCPMRMDNFPFDRQTCHITMASWIYSDEQLRIVIEADAAAKVEINLWSCFAKDRKIPCSSIEVKCHLARLKDGVLEINRLPHS